MQKRVVQLDVFAIISLSARSDEGATVGRAIGGDVIREDPSLLSSIFSENRATLIPYIYNEKIKNKTIICYLMMPNISYCLRELVVVSYIKQAWPFMLSAPVSILKQLSKMRKTLRRMVLKNKARRQT